MVGLNTHAAATLQTGPTTLSLGSINAANAKVSYIFSLACPWANRKDKSVQWNFMACTDAIMNDVPACAKPSIIFTARAAIERPAMHVVQRNVINGKSFQDESDALREVHLKRVYEQMYAYYDYLKRRAENSDEKRKEKNADPKQKSIASFFPAAAPPSDASTSTTKTTQVFPMPKIGEFRVGMGAGFLISVYLAEFKRRQKHLACHLASIGGRALGGDHTFQTAKKVTEVGGEKAYEAVFDIMNEYGQIVALILTNTKSPGEVISQLQDVYSSWEELNAQLPEYMWVDDTSQMEGAMMKAFPTLKNVLEDATHGMRRYARTLPDGHYDTKAFMGDLSKAFFRVVPSDEEQLKKELLEAGRWGAPNIAVRAAAEKILSARCRHTIPEAKQLRQRVEKVVSDHSSVVDPVTGRVLFTPDTFRVHESMLKLIGAGKFSDPLPADKMFLRLNSGKKDKFMGLRGTSKLEGFHCHVAKVLQGNIFSPELVGAMLAEFTHVWNMKRAIANKQGTIDYGCYDTMLLEEINGICKELQLPLQFPELKPTPEVTKIPAMFTLAVPPELVDALCAPEGGIAPLEGASVENDDACVAIEEFENGGQPFPLPIKNSGARATAAATATAGIMATLDSQTVEMIGTEAQPLPSQLVDQQQQQQQEEEEPQQSNLQLQQQPLQQQQQLLEAMVASPAVGDDSNASPVARSPSKQGKRGRGRPSSAKVIPKKKKKEELLLPASPTTAATFSSSPSTAVPRSPRGKRAAMPADFTRPVETEGEASLMLEVIGDAIASPELRSPRKQKQIAQDFNTTVLKRHREDPSSIAGMSFKQAKHVKAFVQSQTESLAVAATNAQVLINQQRATATTAMEPPAPVEALQQSISLHCGIDAGIVASQQATMPVSQQLEEMQQQLELMQQQQQQQPWWPPGMIPPVMPPQAVHGQYYPPQMHPAQPPPYHGYGMYPNLDPAALMQAAAALLQVQQQQQPLAGGKVGGKGAPGKPRNCGKCFKPLKGKNKEEGACFCKSKGVQEAE
ncbi:hypothetical protein NADE_008166 [Nannochloris sp. 'desiccata']|nr:hypothetical protein KSW81_000064 [Chlorella desiccata (nom. nud.)]KAH7619888.1 hypothetical protein NADE_008166 [Chlorella desiccata (nom. nud.)]